MDSSSLLEDVGKTGCLFLLLFFFILWASLVCILFDAFGDPVGLV